MSVRIAPVTEAEKPALWAMLQSYIGELSAYSGGKPDNGVFPYKWFDTYWTDDDRFPFWAISDDARAGFALVRRDREQDFFQMAEFYIDPRCRRFGLGIAFARSLIARYPGRWRIREMAVNTPAIAFWHRVLEIFPFSEETYWEGGLERLEQRFAAW